MVSTVYLFTVKYPEVHDLRPVKLHFFFYDVSMLIFCLLLFFENPFLTDNSMLSGFDPVTLLKSNSSVAVHYYLAASFICFCLRLKQKHLFITGI